MSSWFAKNRMLPLWLQTHSKGKVLWAVNKEHLDFLEHYVSDPRGFESAPSAIIQ
jgi:hypothetical protein